MIDFVQIMKKLATGINYNNDSKYPKVDVPCNDEIMIMITMTIWQKQSKEVVNQTF